MKTYQIVEKMKKLARELKKELREGEQANFYIGDAIVYRRGSIEDILSSLPQEDLK